MIYRKSPVQRNTFCRHTFYREIVSWDEEAEKKITEAKEKLVKCDSVKNDAVKRDLVKM